MALSNTFSVKSAYSNIPGFDPNYRNGRYVQPAPIDVDYLSEKESTPPAPRGLRSKVVTSGVVAPKMEMNRFNPNENMSMPAGEGLKVTKAVNPVAAALEKQYAKEEASSKAYYKGQMALAAGEFLLDVSNANNAYAATTGQAQLNIMMARNQAAEAISRGRQAQMEAQSQGYQAGQSALLNAAAQGQDVNGAATQKVQGSYEAMGIYNGMIAEINSIREAMGFEMEENQYNYQIKNAATTRNNAIIGSALTNATKMATYGAM